MKMLTVGYISLLQKDMYHVINLKFLLYYDSMFLCDKSKDELSCHIWHVMFLDDPVHLWVNTRKSGNLDLLSI